MDITTFIGIFVAGGLVVSAILMGGPGLWFINMPSFMIVIGGTMGATFLAYPLSEVMSVFKVVKNVLLQRSQSPYQLITLISDMSKTVKKEGFLSLEQTLGKIEDPFLAKGIMMFVDGAEKSYVEEVMTTDMVSAAERHKLGAEIFTTMGTFAPAVGMLGTIIGLVQMLMQMDDPSQIGAPMAVALLTTFYGTLMANLLFLPIASKLRTRSKQEILTKQMMLEGMLSISDGEQHRLLENRLKSFLPPRLREKKGKED